MALEHALFQAVRHRHMWYAAVVNKHASMRAEPVAALHVLGGPSEQQLTEAEAGDEDIRLVDLARLQIHPLDRIAGVIHFHAFAGLELARRDSRLPVLRELAIKLFLLYFYGEEALSTGIFYLQVVPDIAENIPLNHLSNER